jgi:hypothetical protein
MSVGMSPSAGVVLLLATNITANNVISETTSLTAD